MNINGSELLSALKFLESAIGKNELRRNLMNIYVETKENQCILTAANAHIAKRAYIEINPQKKEKQFLIPGSIVVLLKSLLTKNKGEAILNKYGSKVNGQSIKFKQPEIDYPDLNSLIIGDRKDQQNIYESDRKIGISPEMIIECMKGFKENRSDHPVVKMETSSSDSPVRFTNQNGTRIAIVMPVSIKW